MPGVVASRELSVAPQVSPGLASHGHRVHLQELARTGAEPRVAGETQPPRAPLTDAVGQSASCRQAGPWSEGTLGVALESLQGLRDLT